MRSMTLSLIFVLGMSAAQAQELEWIHQFGTAGFDQVGPVAADDDGIYVAGSVGGAQALPGEVSEGGTDSFVRSYSSGGSILWTRQFGTSGSDSARELVARDGSLYVAGFTSAAFPGETFGGGVDVFLRRYDASGAELWTRQFGTTGFDVTLGLGVDPSGIYIFGMTSGAFPGESPAGGFDLFLARLDHAGEVIWVRQFGTPGDDPALFSIGGLAVDDTGIYVGSSVAAALPGQIGLGDADAVVRKFDHDGNDLWTRQFGTACLDLLSGVAAGPDGIYVVGSTTGIMDDPLFPRCAEPPVPYQNFGAAFKTYVQALSPEGAVRWMQQDEHGDESELFSLAIEVAVDDTGVFVAGEVIGPRDPGAFDPACAVGHPLEDIRIRAYDLDGEPQWTWRFGGTDTDVPQGIAVSDTGLYVGGVTHCQVAGQVSAGSADGLVMKLATAQ